MTDGAPGDVTQRLFIALALPDPVRAALESVAEPLSGFAWTRPAQLHMTLRFLGDVDPGTLARIDGRLAGVRVEPFLIPVEGVGSFPPRSPPRTIWAGAGAGHPRLYQLRQRLDDAVLAAGLDFDVSHFQPHITLARCTERASAAATQWLHRHRDFTAPPFRVDAFDLFSSELLPDGARHTLVKRYPLS